MPTNYDHLHSFATPAPAVCLPPAARRYSPNSLWRKCYLIGWSRDKKNKYKRYTKGSRYDDYDDDNQYGSSSNSRNYGGRDTLLFQAAVTIVHPSHCTSSKYKSSDSNDSKYYHEYDHHLCVRYKYPKTKHPFKEYKKFMKRYRDKWVHGYDTSGDDGSYNGYTKDKGVCIEDPGALLVCQPKLRKYRKKGSGEFGYRGKRGATSEADNLSGSDEDGSLLMTQNTTSIITNLTMSSQSEDIASEEDGSVEKWSGNLQLNMTIGEDAKEQPNLDPQLQWNEEQWIPLRGALENQLDE